MSDIKLYRAADIPLPSENARLRLIEHQKRINAILDSNQEVWDKHGAIHWQRGRKWMDIVRRQIRGMKNPLNAKVQERFFHNVPICDSGSIYVDIKCINLAHAILTRKIYKALREQERQKAAEPHKKQR